MGKSKMGVEETGLEKSPSVYLTTARLFLRQLTRKDVGLLVDLDSDPKVVKYISDGKPSTPAEVAAAIERILGYYKRFHDRMGLWPAIETATGECIGWFLLRPDKLYLDNVKDLEIGYRLKAKFWGQGYATEMSQALLTKAFTELAAETVFATAMKGNLGSINVMKKIGLQFKAEFTEGQFPGRDQRAVKYMISHKDWITLQALNRET